MVRNWFLAGRMNLDSEALVWLCEVSIISVVRNHTNDRKAR